MLWRLPPIHFGKADGVERTLLRVACQSDFDELVSMAFPSGGSWVWLDGKRLNVISSGEMRVLPDGALAMTFRPAKGRFARTKMANHKSSSASEPPHRARRSAF